VKEKVLMSWSGGKDSAMALYEIQQTGRREAVALLTTVTEGYDRISMHGVRRELLEAQAAAIGLSLAVVDIPPACTNAVYEERMQKALLKQLMDGIRCVAFGDLFLEDIRAWRERNLSRIGMEGLFPVWRRDTTRFAQAFIRLGFKARLVCVDLRKLDESFAGRSYDESLLSDLPPTVDPCGENGEFHTFVHDGPIFSRPIPVAAGERVMREGFCFCDLALGTSPTAHKEIPHV
jgi:uncharacterized protein (TIGR00290 family)